MQSVIFDGWFLFALAAFQTFFFGVLALWLIVTEKYSRRQWFGWSLLIPAAYFGIHHVAQYCR